MAKKAATKRGDSDDKTASAIAGFMTVQEICRVIRWLIIAGTIGYCVTVITRGVVEVMNSDQPTTWQQVALAAVTGIFAFLVGQAPILATLSRFRGYIRTIGNRNVQLEAMVDTTRTSSGINEDGTHDLDA